MKKRTLLLCLLLPLIINLNIKAHNIAPLYDFWYIIKSPVSLEKENLFQVGAFTGVTIGLLLFDENIQNQVQKNKSDDFDRFLRYPEKMGEGGYILAAGGLFIITGQIFDNTEITKLGVYTLEGFLISGIIVTTVKFIIGRARPYKNRGDFYFRPFNLETGYKSFYSGHTTIAFTFASIVANYTKNIYLSTILYTTAALTGIARVYHNTHWSSDVFAAAITGILIGKKIIELNEVEFNKEGKGEQLKITIWRAEL